MKKVTAVLLALLLVALVGSSIFFSATPTGKAMWNNWFFAVQKADDKTNYETRKEVEDACRAMIASYTSDKLTYEQYKDSDSEEKQSWAEQARMRANKTAASYNEYVLKNSFVWEDNIPADIVSNLPYI
ncbi:MAG: hypothetical protein IJN86_01815 [Clostridia bacterium]|nr:hypothetical protein [Clostridia bacterium]